MLARWERLLSRTGRWRPQLIGFFAVPACTALSYWISGYGVFDPSAGPFTAEDFESVGDRLQRFVAWNAALLVLVGLVGFLPGARLRVGVFLAFVGQFIYFYAFAFAEGLAGVQIIGVFVLCGMAIGWVCDQFEAG